MMRMRGTTEERSRRIAERDSRDERDEGGFEVRNSRCSKHRTPTFELQIAPFSQISQATRHSLLELRNRVDHQLKPGRDGFLPVTLFVLAVPHGKRHGLYPAWN